MFASILVALAGIDGRSTLKVCLSPGCVADGADATLAKLVALSPPDVEVEAGSCVSHCGAGPIVVKYTTNDNKDVVHRRVFASAKDAFLELLIRKDGDGDDESTVSSDLLRGYDLVQEASVALSVSNYEAAVPLFAEGIEMALPVAIDLQERRTNLEYAARGNDSDEITNTRISQSVRSATPRGLQWLVTARLGEAKSRLAIGDIDGAKKAATSACDLSRSTDALCFEFVAELCKTCDDTVGEMNALRKMFELEPQGSTPGLPRDVENRRRGLGFRLARIERQICGTS